MFVPEINLRDGIKLSERQKYIKKSLSYHMLYVFTFQKIVKLIRHIMCVLLLEEQNIVILSST